MQLLLDAFASDMYCSSHVEPADHASFRNRREVFHFLSRHSEANVQRSILVNPEIVQISSEYHKIAVRIGCESHTLTWDKQLMKIEKDGDSCRQS